MSDAYTTSCAPLAWNGWRRTLLYSVVTQSRFISAVSVVAGMSSTSSSTTLLGLLLKKKNFFGHYATGLDSQSLIDVEDKDVYSVRGQTVLDKAPGFKSYVMHAGNFNVLNPKLERIDVEHLARVIGTTYPKEWYRSAPVFAGPDGKSWNDIEVVAHSVG
nr:hypothetical protein L203_04363 [Cryptococcus depauperatus CBS 7841]